MATTVTIKPPPKIPPGATLRYPGLDGLRALAISIVVMFHFWPTIIPFGFIGVDVFFVISGYLITRLLVKEHACTGTIALIKFWLNRAKRLLPPLTLVITITLICASQLGGDLLYQISAQLSHTFTFSYNWLLISSDNDYFSEFQQPIFKTFWSLAIEEQFYLLWPAILLLILGRVKRRALVFALAILSVASAASMIFLYSPQSSGLAYYGSFTHVFGLLIGAGLAVVLSSQAANRPRILQDLLAVHNNLLFLSGATVGLFAAYWINGAESAAYKGGMFLICIATAMIISGSSHSASWGAKILGGKSLAWLGHRSYGIYLWHWPILMILKSQTTHQLPGRTIPFIALGLTLLAAGLTYVLLEKPVQNHGFTGSMKGTFSKDKTFRTSGIILICTLICLPLSVKLATTREPSHTALQRQLQTLPYLSQRKGGPDQAGSPGSAADSGQGNSMILLGDSVALASKNQLLEAFPGIVVDAIVSRQLVDARQDLKALAHANPERDTLVLALGTNGVGKKEDIMRVVTEFGDHKIILVTVHAEREWTESINAALREVAQEHTNVFLADWDQAIKGKDELLAQDGVHPGPGGGKIYAEAIRQAVVSEK